MRRALALLLPLTAAAPPLAAQSAGTLARSAAADRVAGAVDPDVLRGHLEFLADDALEGRKPGARGGEVAARYVEAQLARLGLETTRQRVPLAEVRVTGATLAWEGGADSARHLADFFVTHAADTAVEVAGGAVFAGFGITAPDQGRDDYRGLDVRGRVVLVLAGDPSRVVPGAFRAEGPVDHGSRLQKAREAARRGAAALVVVVPQSLAAVPWAVVARAAGEPRVQPGVPAPLPLTVAAAESLATRLLAPLGPLPALVRRAAGADFRGSPLPYRLRLAARAELRRFTADNVVGRLRGRGPAAGETVVIGAHYDHLGIGPPAGGDSVYNGALDNAAGTAGLLALAEAFARSGARPTRSLAFVAFTAEESGLLGSQSFVAGLPDSARGVAAMLNLDALNLFAPTRDTWALGADLSTLGEVFAAAADAEGLVSRISPERRRRIEEGRYFYRSDQLSFVRAGVPALFLWGGAEARDRPAEWIPERWDEYLAQRYHTPADELVPGLEPAAALPDLRAFARTALAVADAAERPRWLPGTPFAAGTASPPSHGSR